MPECCGSLIKLWAKLWWHSFVYYNMAWKYAVFRCIQHANISPTVLYIFPHLCMIWLSRDLIGFIGLTRYGGRKHEWNWWQILSFWRHETNTLFALLNTWYVICTLHFCTHTCLKLHLIPECLFGAWACFVLHTGTVNFLKTWHHVLCKNRCILATVAPLAQVKPLWT